MRSCFALALYARVIVSRKSDQRFMHARLTRVAEIDDDNIRKWEEIQVKFCYRGRHSLFRIAACIWLIRLPGGSASPAHEV